MLKYPFVEEMLLRLPYFQIRFPHKKPKLNLHVVTDTFIVWMKQQSVVVSSRLFLPSKFVALTFISISFLIFCPFIAPFLPFPTSFPPSFPNHPFIQILLPIIILCSQYYCKALLNVFSILKAHVLYYEL